MFHLIFLLLFMESSLIEKYNKEEVIISNPIVFKQKLIQLKKDGPKELDIVTDFDFTLSRKAKDKKGADSTFGIIAKSPFTSKSFSDEYKALYLKYSPIERDQSIPFQEKDEAMKQWWIKSLGLIAEQNLSDGQIIESINKSAFSFRHGFDFLVRIVSKINYSVYILSAGITSVIKCAVMEALKVKKIEPLKIISNEQRVRDDGYQYFAEPLLYVTNKNAHFSREKFPSLKKNAILMGDMIEDTMMTKCSGHKCVLSIGYCNIIEGDTTSLEDFKKHFDIVLKGEGSLIHIVMLLGYIAGDIDFNSTYLKFDSHSLLKEVLATL